MLTVSRQSSSMAVERSHAVLAEAQALGPQVSAVVESLRAVNRRNHFGENIERAFSKR